MKGCLEVNPAAKAATLGRDLIEVVKKKDQPSTFRELGEVEGRAKFLLICSETINARGLPSPFCLLIENDFIKS